MIHISMHIYIFFFSEGSAQEGVPAPGKENEANMDIGLVQQCNTYNLKNMFLKPTGGGRNPAPPEAINNHMNSYGL